MTGYTLNIPEELYEKLRRMARYAPYEYCETDDDSWDLTAPDGIGALDQQRIMDAELINLYFEVLPQIATLFSQQHPKAVDKYSAVPTPNAINLPQAQLTPLIKVAQEQAEEEAHLQALEEEFYAGVPEEDRNYGVTTGLKHYMLRENLGYAFLLEIINDPMAEITTSHNNGYEVPVYTSQRLGYRVVLTHNSSAIMSLRKIDDGMIGKYSLAESAAQHMNDLGLREEELMLILESYDSQMSAVAGHSSRTNYTLNGYTITVDSVRRTILSVTETATTRRYDPDTQPKLSGQKTQRGVKIPSEMAAYIKLLESHGFTVGHGKTHYKVTHDGFPGKSVSMPVTPSDSQRWHKNSVSDVRREFGIDLKRDLPEYTQSGMATPENEKL